MNVVCVLRLQNYNPYLFFPSCFSVNNPIPSNLKSEAKKAAKILREFTEITSRNGPDKLIPAHVIAKAKGLAVLSVIKAGFLVTARGGSGIVLARLPNGSKLIILCLFVCFTGSIEAFAKGGNLTLGGNVTVAIGPLGRNLEGDVALRSSAAVYTYCKSRGLFAGVSLEGTCLIERKETNSKFYGQDIRASAILFGDLPQPSQAEDLYEVLDSFTEKYEIEEPRSNARRTAREQRKVCMYLSLWAIILNITYYFSPAVKTSHKLYPELPSCYNNGGNSWNTPTEVTAVYSFQGQQPGDLTFKAGDKIAVLAKTDAQFDWWEGSIQGETGIFPANYVSMN
uniref:SH3 domain-containing YSC84-like protein 1 n=1 Tax=Sphenodon punctatus TaxID=8508 RepID=A0A8D0GH30_SPHPU